MTCWARALGGRMLRFRALDPQSHEVPSTSRLEHDRGLPTSPSSSQAIRSHSDPSPLCKHWIAQSSKIPPPSYDAL